MTFKPYYILIFSIFCFQSLQAQYTPGPPPNWQQTVNKISSQQQMSQMQMRQMMNMQRMGSNSSIPYSSKYEFTVVLKNDSTFKGRTAINTTGDVHVITIGKRSTARAFVPSDTKYIYRKNEYNKVIKGIPADSCWLFKTVEGKINGYTYVAETDLEYFIFIQKGEGELLKFTPKNVEKLVADNEKALLAAEKEKYYKAIRIYNEVKK